MSIRSLYDRLVPPAACVAHQVVAVFTRLTLAQVFIHAGLGKLRGIESKVPFFADLGIPFPRANVWLVAVVETVGGIALLLGLGTRAFAAMLLGTMVVALGPAHRADLVAAMTPSPEKGDLSDIGPWMLSLLLLWLMAHGAGLLSGDRLIRKMLPAKAPASQPAA